MADWMRNTVESTLGPAKATVRTRTSHRTPTGGTTYTWADGGFSYCAMAPLSGDELDFAGRMGIKAAFTCHISYDLDVDEQDRIVISDSGVDELEGEWEVTFVSVTTPTVDRLLYLARTT